MTTIRTLVVEDSFTVRKHIVDVLDAAPGFEVVGEAGDGKTAIELCERLRPDVITMDMMLPVMTGLAATEYIMAFCPTPILVVSASTNRGELFKTYDALGAGAVDVLDKPGGAEPDDVWEKKLLQALRVVARIPVISHPRGRLGPVGLAPRAAPPPQGTIERHHDPRVIGIGASTGGPAAILAVLSALPASFPLPILLVIHISEPFGAAMAEWLDGLVPLPVRYARGGERLPAVGGGCVLMAPPERHLVVRDERVLLTSDAELHSCRPSVDVLFHSLSSFEGQAIGCLLTGMGRDGAAGLLAMRQAGALTIAQDEATSVVFGMPGEAVRLNAAAHVSPLPDISSILMRAAARRQP